MKKVAVVGGGPAGLYAAIEGAKNGAAVTLFEKYRIGDNIRCAEGFFDSTNTLGEPCRGVKYKVEAIILALKADYTFPCGDKINIWMLDRQEWQTVLAGEARNLGVEIIENCPVDKERLKKTMSVYDYVIDATGVPSISSILFDFIRYYTETSAVTAQYKLHGDFSHLDRKIKAGFEEHYLGYYWIFPKSSSESNVGIGWYSCSRFPGKNLSIWKELDRVCSKEKLSACKIVKKSGGLCPVKKVERLVYENLILAGDAAGLASPLHAGGIDTACISGRIAMQCALKDKAGDYETELDKAIGRKLANDRALLKIWESLSYYDMDILAKILCKNESNQLGFKDLLSGTFSVLKNIKSLTKWIG